MEPEDIDPSETLNTMGLDSLMAIELGNKMQTLLGLELPMSVYLEGPTVSSLADFVGEQLNGSDELKEAETTAEVTELSKQI